MKKFVFILCIIGSIFAQKTFVGCEGNFYQSNGSLWTLEDGEAYEYPGSPLGEIVQSLYIHDDRLFVTVNGGHAIYVFNIEDSGLTQVQLIDTNMSSPREMIVHDNYLYVSNWYSADIKKYDLSTWEIVEEIPMPGLPEDMVLLDDYLYASITMNFDWTDGSKVVKLNPYSSEIVETFEVGDGPGDLLVHNKEIFISRTYYDQNWNAYHGTSKIDESGDVILVNYGSGGACGGAVMSYQNSVYRVYDGGIAKLDDDLLIMPETRIGNFNLNDVYSVDVHNDKVYFGLTDFSSPDQVVVLNSDGDVLEEYMVGVAPGDFAFWERCVADGDLTGDNQINVSDIVLSVSNIVNDMTYYDCRVDLNNDNVVNVVDIVMLVQDIMNIESFSGAVNWLNHHFPEFKPKDRLKKLQSKQTQ
tara:strand:+ start:1041 stop:2282 length:1242 start_codon:yes stop_codon:yes gene_type:complete